MAERRVLASLLAIVLALIGLALLGGGIVLVSKGGSPYYALAGIAVLVSAFGLFRGRHYAAIVYGVMLAATMAWSLWEVGLDGWALAPRLIGPTVLALLFLLPPVARASASVSRWWVGLPIIATIVVFAASIITANQMYDGLKPATPVQSVDSENGEWRVWGRTLTGQRYTPLSQITIDNVSQLKPAWTYKSDVPDHGGDGHSFQATPLAVDGRLYVCLDRAVVVALDQDDGKEIWRADPQANLEGVYAATCRGVAYYEAPQPVAECQKRILFGAHDGRLLAVDAETGNACTSFGKEGTVDLKFGMGELPPGVAYPTSPPTIVNGIAVVGQWVTDGMALNMPSGVIRGYDAMTGELRWAWDIGHPERTTLAEGETYTRGTPNAWGVFSGDEALGLVYIGTGNATPDYFGAHRTPEDEKYASAIVALDTATGKVRWSFQTVHHDVWDFDVMAQPVLLDIDSPEGKIPALLASTKRATYFLLDRRDGRSLDGVEEKPVPQNPPPGEWLSKTQPYPTKGFPNMVGPDFREADMWGLTPLDQLWCRVRFKDSRYEGQFTPPSLQPTILYPGSAGGSNWGALTIDPERNLMISNTLHVADYARAVPRTEADQMKATAAEEAKAAAAAAAKGKNTESGVPDGMRTAGHGARYAYLQPQEGTPYAIYRSIFISPLATLCQPPPYGKISVFDINTRKLLWSKPLGTIKYSGPFEIPTGLPITMGVPTIGGSLASAGGVIFIGASQDRRFRAIDVASGKELWSFELPTAGAATPMSYLSKKSGKQFVVIAAGGHPALGGPRGGELVAFALPAK